MSLGNESHVNACELCVIITYRESSLMPVIEDVFSKSYHMLCRRHIDQNVLANLIEMIKDEEVASRVATMNCVESEHSVLKLWLSTSHGDLDTVFLNIESLIKGQIVEIKSSLEFSRLKENFSAKSNPILMDISNKISHLALKKIRVEIKRVPEIINDPMNKTLEIGADIPSAQAQDMDSEMRDLASLLDRICTSDISKVKEMMRLKKGVLSPVLPEDPGTTLTILPEYTTTKGRRKRTQPKGTSRTRSTYPLHIER
ncbi:hypothetical protein M9H77_27813 [Catharanthus roseus]|uniref:Uncharacterized protein n=1 Tax=Catharanthus roseus TaxID=4058 RepID=A0ACC0ADS3_CATRO|nr:hypothetical protein M9H77_27813 [Catharanthus roseus]